MEWSFHNNPELFKKKKKQTIFIKKLIEFSLEKPNGVMSLLSSLFPRGKLIKDTD